MERKTIDIKTLGDMFESLPTSPSMKMIARAYQSSGNPIEGVKRALDLAGGGYYERPDLKKILGLLEELNDLTIACIRTEAQTWLPAIYEERDKFTKRRRRIEKQIQKSERTSPELAARLRRTIGQEEKLKMLIDIGEGRVDIAIGLTEGTHGIARQQEPRISNEHLFPSLPRWYLDAVSPKIGRRSD
jgi:hypothetical protein